MIKFNYIFFTLLILLIIVKFSSPKEKKTSINTPASKDSIIVKRELKNKVTVTKDITVKNYFQYLDSIVQKYDSLTSYELTEHLLVRVNPWIIDTLQNTDYYRMKARDSFVYNQKEMIVLQKGVDLVIPDSISAKKILESFRKTIIDINIPEFKLRIIEDTIKLYEFPVRVGRNEEKYLEMSGRVQNLKTKTGKGIIVNHVRDPAYINPSDNRRYFVTKRDDKKITKLPQIPFIETEINGLRHGQLIHPTTNPVTLGRAYSNGCIGTKEADAWVIYYHAPLNTKISIRYNLDVVNQNGDSITLKDIYRSKN